jgi:hypothetical protein
MKRGSRLDPGIESADRLKMRKSQSEFVTMATMKPQKISKRLEECIILKANFCIIDPNLENVTATVPHSARVNSRGVHHSTLLQRLIETSKINPQGPTHKGQNVSRH